MNQELLSELNKRDKKRYLEELVELENSLASAHKGVFWTTLNLLIVDPLLVVGTVWYFWNQIEQAIAQRLMIANLWENIKLGAIIIAITFTITSLTLLYYLWKVASLKREIAQIRAKISRLE